MREYGKVHSSFWSSKTVGELSEDGRTLALYLLTSPHSNIAGVFRLPDGYATEDLKWGSERVAKGFAELFLKGFANRCETTKWVYVCKHFEWNPLENPNQRKAAKKIAQTIPDECAWKLDFMRVRGESLGIDPAEFPNPPETLSKPFLNQEQEQEQEQDECAEQETLSLVPVSPPPIALISLPLVGDGLHPIHADELVPWRKAYPGIDVMAELQRMRVWLTANPRKRKTARGINAFIVSWLTRAQDNPRRATGTYGGDVDEHGVPL